MKRAFLVLGAESSGTRMVISMFISAGCFGDFGHEQRIDSGVPDDEPCIVWRRSVPHRNEIPNIHRMILELERKDYEVTAVVTHRDWYAMAKSQVNAPHAANGEIAIKQAKEAYRHIFDSIIDIDYVMVNYEMFQLQPESVNSFLYMLGLEKQTPILLYNGNEKYNV